MFSFFNSYFYILDWFSRSCAYLYIAKWLVTNLGKSWVQTFQACKIFTTASWFVYRVGNRFKLTASSLLSLALNFLPGSLRSPLHIHSFPGNQSCVECLSYPICGSLLSRISLWNFYLSYCSPQTRFHNLKPARQQVFSISTTFHQQSHRFFCPLSIPWIISLLNSVSKAAGFLLVPTWNLIVLTDWGATGILGWCLGRAQAWRLQTHTVLTPSPNSCAISIF